MGAGLLGGGRELVIGGLLVSSFVGYGLGALVILLALRLLFKRLGFDRIFANPPLAEAALYVCILGLLVLLV